eukprot:COSAG05_NODE_496_length_9256_cov_9.286557_5_plen_115_part_00
MLGDAPIMILVQRVHEVVEELLLVLCVDLLLVEGLLLDAKVSFAAPCVDLLICKALDVVPQFLHAHHFVRIFVQLFEEFRDLAMALHDTIHSHSNEIAIYMVWKVISTCSNQSV